MNKCGDCDREFFKKKSLVRHRKLSCGKNVARIICGECRETFRKRIALVDHIEHFHGIVIEKENKEFITFEDFLKWKEEVEADTLSSYVAGNHKKLKNGTAKKYLVCHRSGFFNSRSKGIKRIKSQGTNKINSTCPSIMVVTMSSGKPVHVEYMKTHFGHEINIGRCALGTKERTIIAGKIAEGVAFERIIDDIRDNVDNIYDPISLITRRDLHNIKRDFGLFEGRQYESDFVCKRDLIQSKSSKSEVNISIIEKAGQAIIDTNSEQIKKQAQMLIGLLSTKTIPRNDLLTVQKKMNSVLAIIGKSQTNPSNQPEPANKKIDPQPRFCNKISRKRKSKSALSKGTNLEMNQIKNILGNKVEHTQLDSFDHTYC